jgi:hypothetical protein
MLLSCVKFMQCLENGIMCVNICVIHMQVVSTDSSNVIPFQDIQMLSLPSRSYNIHSITHGSIYMVQCSVCSLNMQIYCCCFWYHWYVISNVKCSSCLPNISQWIIQAFHSVNAVSVILISSYMPLQNEFKHNDNWIKVWQPPSKNIKILIRFHLIFNDL